MSPVSTCAIGITRNRRAISPEIALITSGLIVIWDRSTKSRLECAASALVTSSCVSAPWSISALTTGPHCRLMASVFARSCLGVCDESCIYQDLDDVIFSLVVTGEWGISEQGNLKIAAHIVNALRREARLNFFQRQFWTGMDPEILGHPQPESFSKSAPALQPLASHQRTSDPALLTSLAYFASTPRV